MKTDGPLLLCALCAALAFLPASSAVCQLPPEPPAVEVGPSPVAAVLGDVLPPDVIGQPVPLLQPDFPKGLWTHYSAKRDTPLSETWTLIADAESGKPVLVCKGEPNGYLRTVNPYRNFELNLEWRFPEQGSGNNSGILLFTSEEARIWPSSVQVQLYQPELGRTFANGSVKADNEISVVPVVANPVGKWNRCVITCRNGAIQVCINDKEIGRVTGCNPDSGFIGLQSEGSEIHFRNLLLRELPEPLLTESLPPPPEPQGASLVQGQDSRQR